MTSRKRNITSTSNNETSRIASSKPTAADRRAKNKRKAGKKRRQHLLETLESRQLLAGPQLIGIQPNEGDLIVNGSVRDTAPRVLTFRFDQNQQIDPDTFEGIRITRAGDDGLQGTADDVRIAPGLVTLGESANEVVVRFSETLVDDNYRIEVFGFNDDGLGVTGLSNLNGELFQPRGAGQRLEVVNFDLRLGALIEAIVPQPVVRLSDGSLVQNRDEIVVYFNEDPLFVEDDSATGTIQVGGQQISITANFSDRSFDDVEIILLENPTASETTAVNDAAARTIRVTYPTGASYGSIATAINNLAGGAFSAAVTQGSPSAVFVPPADPNARFEVTGNPTPRSAENPRFYQLLLTQETVRTTDDALYLPEKVVYDPITHTARLFFASDLNELGADADGNAGVAASGGTFRLRIGTAVDDRIDLILPPIQTPVAPAVTTDFGIDNFLITFRSKQIGEAASGRQVRFENVGTGGLSVRLDSDGNVVFNFGGSNPQVRDLQTVAASTPGVQSVLDVSFEFNGAPGAGGTLQVPSRIIGAAPLTMVAVGDHLGGALDAGFFGRGDALTSLVFSEAIDPMPLLLELPGGNDDPGHRNFDAVAASDLVKHINALFGADSVDGITEIPYNFKGVFERSGGNAFLNQIDTRQKARIREAIELWSAELGIQFRETVDQGITFAVGEGRRLLPLPGTQLETPPSVGYTVRIDPTFANSALVFSTNSNLRTAYGESFFRSAMSGIGFLLGLEAAPDLPPQTVMNLNPLFINSPINTEQVAAGATVFEPIFPGNFDVLHGQHLHRPDSIDVDLYRFVVDLGDPNRVGTLTAETFAERLPDSSLLDTTLTLFEEVQASAITDFGFGIGLQVRFDAVARGIAGNNARLDFILSDRTGGDNSVRVSQQRDLSGRLIENVILVDLPRGAGVSSLTVGDVITAINNNPFASSILRASLVQGAATTDIRRNELAVNSLTLRGGGLQQLSRNDDYFSEDSRVIASLSNGTYYIGVAASGNDNYDPTIPGSGFGGRTQGKYDLHLKFEPQVDESEAIRDLDNPRVGVPGTIIDGDADGTPGGANNFWFQTRPLNRILNFTEGGDAVTSGQTVTVTGANNVVRRYEFVPLGSSAQPGNIAVFYNPGTAGVATPPSSLATALQSAINSRTGSTGVRVDVTDSSIVFSGERSIAVSSNFTAGEVFGRTIFVDKTAGPTADGSLARPFNNISNPAVANAFGAALAGDIVRIVGNGGADQDLATEADNFSYQIGISDTGGQTLEDGRTMEVPQGVTTMIDAGAAFKLRNARIGVGSSTFQVDRSGGVLQVLGTPRLVQLSREGTPVRTTLQSDFDTNGAGYEDGSVIFTSTRDRLVHTTAAGISPAAAPGDWGGLVFRRDLDLEQGRRDLEDQGIFLQTVNHAEIRYGGSSNLLIDSVQTLVNPIQIISHRPNITFNEISLSADAAISASPNSFGEDSFQSPRFQQAGEFTADYDRVGPDIYRNRLIDNSINGLFIRALTSPNRPVEQLTVAGRLDDTDIVHYLAENLVVAGQPGGPIADGVAPDLSFVSGRRILGGSLQAAPSPSMPNYEYRMTFVDADGFESKATNQTDTFRVAVTDDNTSLELIGLPVLDPASDYVSRRLYRAQIVDDNGNTIPVANRQYLLVADLDSTTDSYIDDGSASDGVLDVNRVGLRGRLDGSLVFDPGLVLKLRGSRIELGFGTQLLAEGLQNSPIVMTSSLDDRFGGGGTFDTNNDNQTSVGAVAPSRGDWSGIYASPGANVSLDHTVVAFGGGISLLEGGSSRGFAPLELQQADGRVTNTRFEFNDSGQKGAGLSGRQGRLANEPSVIFVRGSQPTIVGNAFIDNRGSIITIDSESMTANLNVDEGRQTGAVDTVKGLDDNRGPLIRRNTYDVVAADELADRQISGLDIRAGVTVTVESVFDDTDIVHILDESLIVGNFHSGGGLRLMSRPDESLVVKLTGGGNPNSPTSGTGFTATGTPSDIADRIGGSIQILGRPGAPVVLTSINDDTVGAGRRPDGSQFTDTNGDSFGSRPMPNDWRSILLDQYSNDRNVDVQLEQELPTAVAPGNNGTVDRAQFLGSLAPNLSSSDDQRRLGFEVEGFLSGPTDVDTYSFTGIPGTEVWIDIDRTTYTLDSVIELLDSQGRLLARSDNSMAEINGSESLTIFDEQLRARTTSLQSRADEYTRLTNNGQYADFSSLNPRDAGIHLSLPGTVASGSDGSTYFFRIRSASVDPNDVSGGLTSGAYRFQIRLTEEQEFPGSVVRYADIRFANHGIHLQGLPGSSPLLGEAQENESVINPSNQDISAGTSYSPALFASNDSISPATTSIFTGSQFIVGERPFARPQNLGNLTGNKANVISVGGSLSNSSFDGTTQTNDAFDIDFYQFEINPNDFGAIQFPSTVFDIDYAAELNSRPDTRLSVFFDPDGERGPQRAQLIYVGADSNVAEDQSSPGSTNDLLERLARGSVSSGDPLIGPVALREGTYYVAVSEQGRVPSELLVNNFVRREPINSVERIAVDRVNSSSSDTGGTPQIPRLFEESVANAGGFEFTQDRGNEFGHGNPRSFNAGPAFYTEGVSPETPFEFGDNPTTAEDLEQLGFRLTDNPAIGGAAANPNSDTSTVIPHVTVQANLAGDRGDFYRIVVPNDGTRVIFDVDNGMTTDDGSGFGDVDVDLVVINTTPGFATVPNRITTSSDTDGGTGSFGVLGVSADPFFDGILDQGEYFIGIVPSNVTVTIDPTAPGGVVLGNQTPPTSGTYTLHVSVEDHAIGFFGPTETSIHFDRPTATSNGQLVSEPFSLAGYTAGDQANFYFNYFYDPRGGDNVTYVVTSDQAPLGSGGEISRNNLVPDSTWRQNVLNLSAFAGHTGVQVTFNYTLGSSPNFGQEGLYLDDFIVGFAERGEEVFFSRAGNDTFVSNGSGGGTGGKYQLELRRGTEYVQADAFGTPQLLRSFDTNDRHDRQITLVTPAASQVTQGAIFEISDGAVRQRFQFEIDGVPGNAFDAIPIRVSSTATAIEVAEVIRAAINQSTRLDIEAASSGGLDTDPMTDNRLNLFGAVNGTFDSIDSASGAPSSGTPLGTDADGNLLMPAILFDGVGDSNFLRTQGQVIIESNKISDVRAIGIWSEAGTRDVDEEDLRQDPESFSFFGFTPHPFLQQPLVGNPYPGAVRNLPVANDSVLGGLAPGVVVRNNTIDQAGYAGVKVDGEARPWVITGLFGTAATSGIADGYAFAVDAAGTRVVFEFDDVSGAPVPAGGSGVTGGDGVADGHIPIYYRAGNFPYNNVSPAASIRDYVNSNMELMTLIHQAIQGSILVTNGLVELVNPVIGPDPFVRSRPDEGTFLDEDDNILATTRMAFPSAGVFVYGASNIYESSRYQKVGVSQAPFGFSSLNFRLAPISDPVQPVAQIVNNTIYGADGTEAENFELATREENDLLDLAIDTKVGRSHVGPYIQTATIESATAGVVASDVDFYRVELRVGDRLVVDIDTPNSAVNTVVQIFNSIGQRQAVLDANGDPITVFDSGTAPDHLDPLSTAFNPVADLVDGDDPFVDFTALATGTYYVSVSSAGHDDFDPNDLSGRHSGTGGSGDYDIGLEVYAPRSVVMSLDNGQETNGATVSAANNTGIKAGDTNGIIGTTFTVTQIPDFAPGTPAQVGGPARTVGNQITFEFTDAIGNRLILPNGNVNVPLITNTDDSGYRVPDIMRAIQEAVRGLQDPIGNFDIPTIPNHEFGNGPQGRSGPIRRATATALGGKSGDNDGIVNLSDGTLPTMFHYNGPFDSDFLGGFGHNRAENGNLNIIPQGTLTDGDGTTELYVLWENIAKIELSPEAIRVGLKLTPDSTKPQFSQESDQLLAETGILVSGGSSATILNNVVVNTHQSVVVEETSYFGFGQRVRNSSDEYIKPQDVVVSGNAFQYDEPRNNQIRFDLTWPIDIENPFDVVDTGLSTDAVVGATNVASDADDFNFVVAPREPLLNYPAGNNFVPLEDSIIVDSAINTLAGRDAFVSVNQSVGLAASNIVAPARDVEGILRADNPRVAPPGGLGSNVFKDRGSNELADFNGPVAVLEVPLDNDAADIDTDPAVSFLRLRDGTYTEFRIQLQDNGDASDPFIGTGVDDSTVAVSEIPGLRSAGANVTLFEDERLLREGIDYTFNYDQSKNIVTLKPLAGIWRNDRAYRIELNNRDRNVLVAPDADQINDGDQLSITDSNGGTLVFEFESGYSLLIPDPITLIVPEVGTNAGGLSDGDIFQINDGLNPPVVFEFNSDAATLPGTVKVALPSRQTPIGEDELAIFLAEITNNIATAIENEVTAGRLNVDVRVIGTRIVVGAEPGATAITSGSGLRQLSRTLALRVPTVGVGQQGVQDGDQFILNTGNRTVVFELDLNNNISNQADVRVPISALGTGADVATAIRNAVVSEGLNASVTADGLSVYLNLPADGSVTVQGGQLTVVGISRTPTDGDTLVLDSVPSGGNASEQFTFEINRTDEPDANGVPMNDLVTAGNIAININRATTAEEFAGRIANAISVVPGVDAQELQVLSGGLLAVGGASGLGLVSNSPQVEVIGTPSVTGKSTVEIFGPLLLTLPLVGGGAITSGSVVVLQDPLGNDVIFEFALSNSTAPLNVPGAIRVNYDTFSSVDVVANNLVLAINGSTAGITAQNLGIGRVSLGRIPQSRVNISGIPSPTNPGTTIPGLSGATLRRGIVSDGEVLTIRQGAIAVTFEFEAAVGGGGVQTPGAIAVPFQPGSTVGDVAVSLAAAINNNIGNLRLTATAERDSNGNPTGSVNLDDEPGTIIDVSQAPTLNVTGVPGGATPIRISPAFGPNEVKLELIRAINSVNQPGQPAVTTLSAEDRGGATFFVANGALFDGPLQNFSLPAISDLAGNPLEPNRNDLSSQFTILLPTVGLDFGDAPDPVNGVPGRYPTNLVSNGPRHVVDTDLFLGRFVDRELDGVPTSAANGDDLQINASNTGTLFATTIVGSTVEISLQPGVDPLTRDGDTITIVTATATATFEFDLNGRFDEDNFAIRPTDPTSAESIADAIIVAINESSLQPANLTTADGVVVVDADDEDGVSFISATNPSGVLNRGVALPIEVTVSGAGVLEAWLDFNADGDWDDPGEQIIPMQQSASLSATRDALCPGLISEDRVRVTSNIFADAGEPVSRTFCIVVPATTPIPATAVETYARFRVSREGGLSPTGLALSGEVEDHAVTLLPGQPPQINANQANRTFAVDEDRPLQALDRNGVLTSSANDDGLLAGVADPDGDAVEIFNEDVGTRTLFDALDPSIVAGELNLRSDGTFTFLPAPHYNGNTRFSARVSDINALAPENSLVNSRPISVTINVAAVNDPPVAQVSDVIITRTINEDTVQVFSVDDVGGVPGLIGNKYVAGPANELNQPLIIQSAGSARGAFLTSQGGTITIGDAGRTVTYTPPADYNGTTPDTFTYVVADVPGAGQVSEVAAKQGTVTINIVAVNDPPRTTNDNFSTDEDTPLTIPVNGTSTAPGILDNDTVGPPDEIAAGQTITLATGQFPKATFNNGSVTLSGGNLIYTPPSQFSGVDQFQYTVVDNLGASATATVSINIGGVNNAPVFIGIDGDLSKQSIVRDEAKVQQAQAEFDLTAWFRDPESDPLTFTVASSNASVVEVELTGSDLTLTFPPFGFGQAELTVTATDPSGASVVKKIPVTVNDTPDPPSVIGTLQPLSGTEDQLVVADLSSVFSDPDGPIADSSYSVARIGSIVNPTAAQIAAHPLVQSISFVNGQLRVQLKPNQSGAVDLEIAVTDNSFRVSDSFTLTVASVPDAPIANADGYNVPVGGQLQIVNPSNGLLRNDSDADGDSIQIDMTSVVGPSRGTLNLNANGTFTYTNQSGTVGDTDSFSYRVLDATGRPSDVVTVTLTLNQSRYQNPLGDLSEDVNADGQISAIDALRIINFLSRALVSDDAISVPVSQIGTPPPDFLDTNGDGRVSASDALRVINRLSRVNSGQGEQLGSLAASSITTSMVSAASLGLPLRNLQTVPVDEPLTTFSKPADARDAILTAGFEISSAMMDNAADILNADSEVDAANPHSIDAALSTLLDDYLLDESFNR